MKAPAPASPKRRGRPPGSGLGVKRGPRPGSRPYALANLAPGECLWLAAPKPLAGFMQQVAADIHRVGLGGGQLKQVLFIAIQPSTREVVDLVRVTRSPE